MLLFCCRWADGLTLPGELCGSAAVGNGCPCCRADASVSLGTLQVKPSLSTGTCVANFTSHFPGCLHTQTTDINFRSLQALHNTSATPRDPWQGCMTYISSSAPHLRCHERQLHIWLLVRDARILCLLRGGLQQPGGVLLPLTAVQLSMSTTVLQLCRVSQAEACPIGSSLLADAASWETCMVINVGRLVRSLCCAPQGRLRLLLRQRVRHVARLGHQVLRQLWQAIGCAFGCGHSSTRFGRLHARK